MFWASVQNPFKPKKKKLQTLEDPIFFTTLTYSLPNGVDLDGEGIPDGQVDLDPLGADGVVGDADVDAGIVNLDPMLKNLLRP